MKLNTKILTMIALAGTGLTRSPAAASAADDKPERRLRAEDPAMEKPRVKPWVGWANGMQPCRGGRSMSPLRGLASGWVGYPGLHPGLLHLAPSAIKSRIRDNESRGAKALLGVSLMLPPGFAGASLPLFENEDIEPNLDHELDAASARLGKRVTIAKDIRAAFIAISRGKRKVTNDADRLRKYLARFGLDWKKVRHSE